MPTKPTENWQTLELPDATEDALINAGIAADPDTLEVSDEQFKSMYHQTASLNKRSIITGTETSSTRK